jgi:hypothetical protein
MLIDYPDGAGVQQPQSPPAVQTRVDVCSQSPKEMSNEQLALWLKNHPSLTGTDYEEDISKLRGTHAACANIIIIQCHDIVFVALYCIVIVILLSNSLDARINGPVFLNLNESSLRQFGISLGFRFAVMSIIEDMVSS